MWSYLYYNIVEYAIIVFDQISSFIILWPNFQRLHLSFQQNYKRSRPLIPNLGWSTVYMKEIKCQLICWSGVPSNISWNPHFYVLFTKKKKISKSQFKKVKFVWIECINLSKILKIFCYMYITSSVVYR